jgi:hypothetical protein
VRKLIPASWIDIAIASRITVIVVIVIVVVDCDFLNVVEIRRVRMKRQFMDLQK